MCWTISTVRASQSSRKASLGRISSRWAGPYRSAYAGSATSESKRIPPLKKNQCSARWLDAPITMDCARTASASSRTTSRPGPMAAAFQRVSSESYMTKPS